MLIKLFATFITGATSKPVGDRHVMCVYISLCACMTRVCSGSDAPSLMTYVCLSG